MQQERKFATNRKPSARSYNGKNGEPCKRCGSMERYISNGACVQCQFDTNAKRDRDARGLQVCFMSAKYRAKQKGIEFTIKIEDLECPKICPVLSIEITRKLKRSNSPSIDRVDPTKGYTKENVCVISNRANSLKNSMTEVELTAILEYIKFQKSKNDP